MENRWLQYMMVGVVLAYAHWLLTVLVAIGAFLLGWRIRPVVNAWLMIVLAIAYVVAMPIYGLVFGLVRTFYLRLAS